MGTDSTAPFARLQRYNLMAEVLSAQANQWVKVSPDSLNGTRNAVSKALAARLGAGDVQVKNKGLDIYARLLTCATVMEEV